MKKALKIFGITIVIIIAILVALPFMFQSQLKDMVKQFINDNLNAKVEFRDVNLSFLSSFPQAHVSIDNLIITTFEPFKDKTLATAKSISFDMSVRELFKKTNDEPIVVNSIKLDEIMLTIISNDLGNVNYDIIKTNENKETSIEKEKNFSFNVEDYAIKNSAITYLDEESNTTIYVTELNHSGKGIFSEDVSELETTTEAHMSLSIDSTQYLNNNSIKLEALFDLDLKNNIYTLKDNNGLINNLHITFNGKVKMLEKGQDIDLSFENPGSSFKDFLAVLPQEYSKNLDDVITTGNFKVKGLIKGINSDTSIPNFDINFSSNNASFKYPNLPKRVENIVINASFKNNDGNVDNTYFDIQTLNFKIDEDIFKSSATLNNIPKNMLVNANIAGVLNLSSISKAYPISLDKELSGVLRGKINTSFDVNALESNAFERIKNNGDVSISDFIFSSEDIVNPIHISEANMTFKPGHVTLNNFDARTGDSDIKASGTISNLLGFLLSDNKLQGNFNVKSNSFVVSDFMVADNSSASINKTTDDEESLKIPAFLDCTIHADAQSVLYDNLNLKNVIGKLIIKDEQALLENMTSEIFDGDLTISGLINTKNKIPVFNINLGANDFDISQSFKDLQLLQSLAPIAQALKGKLNTSIQLSGTLDKEFTPELNSVTGNALAELLTTSINSENFALFDQLNGALDFIDFNKLDLKDLKTKLDFENGQVNVAPFELKYEDIDIKVHGSHGFDKTINYNVVFQVPAKYLGSEINQLIGRINDEAVNNITIPVNANIGGTFTLPTVSTDLSSSITKLTKQLIDIEKEKLLDQGSEQLSDIINDVFGGNEDNVNETQNSDSTQTQTPPTSPNTTVEDGVKDILNDLLGGKKKGKTEKDTVN